MNPTLGVITNPIGVSNPLTFRVTRGSGAIVVREVRYGESFKDGTEVMRVRVEPLEPDTEVEVEGDLPVDVAFGERKILLDDIKRIRLMASAVVELFEPDFP